MEIYKDDIFVRMYKRGPKWLIGSPLIKKVMAHKVLI